MLFMSLILSVTERSDGETQIHVICLWLPKRVIDPLCLNETVFAVIKTYGAPDVVLSWDILLVIKVAIIWLIVYHI